MKKQLSEEQKAARREIRRKFNEQLVAQYKIGMTVARHTKEKEEVGQIKDILVDSRANKPYFVIALTTGETRISAGRHIKKFLILSK